MPSALKTQPWGEGEEELLASRDCGVDKVCWLILFTPVSVTSALRVEGQVTEKAQLGEDSMMGLVEEAAWQLRRQVAGGLVTDSIALQLTGYRSQQSGNTTPLQRALVEAGFPLSLCPGADGAQRLPQPHGGLSLQGQDGARWSPPGIPTPTTNCGGGGLSRGRAGF